MVTSLLRCMLGSTVSLTPVSLNSIDVMVVVVGATTPGAPGIVLVVESKIGTLSPILIFAVLLFTTRILGFARVLASDWALRKSRMMWLGRAKRKLAGPSDFNAVNEKSINEGVVGRDVTPGGTTPKPACLAKFTPNLSLLVLSTSSTSISNITSPGFRS